MSTPGRKTKLTQDLQDSVCQHIESGQFQEVAAQLVGIHPATFWRWLAMGEDQTDPDTGKVKPAPARYREFRDAVTRARVRAEAANALQVRLAAQNGDWKAAAWWLERVAHERWGRKDRVEHTGKGGGPIEQRTALGFSSRIMGSEAGVRAATELLALLSGTTSAPGDPGGDRLAGE